MKKFLSVMVAGAMALSLAAPTFAADAALDSISVLDGDGNALSDGSSFTGTNASNGIITADPVRPNCTFYVPLGVGAESAYPIITQATWDDDNDGGTTPEVNASKYSASTVSGTVTELTLQQMVNDDLFKFDVNKDENSKMIKSIELVTEKSLPGHARTSYLKFVLNDTTSTSEIKSDGTITFEAKSANPADGEAGEWTDDAAVTINYILWISNKAVGNDDEADIGDGVYMDPEANEENTLIWGDDRAALKFNADDDASKFYARLSTKADPEIYAEYGDPVNADLWFYDYVGNPTIPSTSRATLTLGIPWDEDSDYTPDPQDCFIYQMDSEGFLEDVTDNFTYSEDEQEIAGWSIQTRTLGTYILSDTELNTDYVEESSEVESEAATESEPDKTIPNTGSSDMVNVAVVAAVLSLAAAGAVAFKKSTK
ncbi:LPXTG cell wall anchor domain-containing protein [Oscillospiraceae bacterium PP1C4]